MDADSYRALAHSSPWRWRTLHFTRHLTRHPTRHTDLGEVEAWVRRPGELLVRRDGDPDEYVSGAPYTISRAAFRSTPQGVVAVDPGPDLEVEQEPVFRPDGLVAERPADWHLEHGDPMWHDYTWTAMLDPDELSHHVEVDDVRAGQRHGREVWWARLRPVDGYEPRCGCCPLLWSEVAAVGEYGDDPARLARFAAEGYPDAYDVALDVQTGVLVALEPVGAVESDRGFTVEIHAADADVDEVFEGRSPTS